MAEQGEVIEVKYFRTEGGVLYPPKEFTITVENRTLQEIISKAILEEVQDVSEPDFRCFPGDFQRKPISLQQKPRQVQYIVDAIRMGTNPVLYLCKEFAESSSGVSSSSSDSLGLLLPEPFERKPSFFIQDFMNESDRLSLASSTHSEYEDEIATMEFGFQRNRDSQSSTGSEVSTIEFKERSNTTLPNSVSSSAMSGGKTRTMHARYRQAKPKSRPKSSMFPRWLQVKKMDSNPEFFEELVATDTVSHENELQKSESAGSITHTTKQPLAKQHSAITFDISAPQPVDPFETMNATCQDRKWDRKKRKAIIRRRSTISFDKIEEVRVETEDGSTMLIPCTDFTTIGELKNTVVTEYLELWGNLSMGSDASRQFMLTCSCEGKEYEMLNETQFLWKTRYYDQFAEGKTDVKVKLQVAKQLPEQELRFLYRTSQLTGVLLDESLKSFGDTDHLARIVPADQTEVQWTRRTLHDLATEVASSRDAEQYSLSMELVSGEMPIILDLKVPTDNKVEITFHYKHTFSLTKRINVNQHADSVLAEVFSSIVSCGLAENRIEDYTLQFTGEESYIHGRNVLLTFKDIRRCITKGEPIHLSITQKPSTELDKPHEFSWLPLEPCSNEIPQHAHINITERTGVTSIWDRSIEENFSFVIKKVENIPFSSSSKLTMFAKATLYHGGKPLHRPYTTSTRYADGRVYLSERAEFDIQKRSLPRAAKIMLVVREGTSRRESAAATPRFLYWGLFPVFNHRGILCSGEQVLRLWQGKKLESGKKGRTRDTVVLEPNPCAPPANNPHPQAVRITVIFDTPAVPVMYPSTCKPSYSKFFEMHPVIRNTATRRQFKALLEFVKEKGLYSKLPDYIVGVDWGNTHILCIIPQKLPDYIVGVNWSNLPECLEVYSFLDHLMDVIDTIPVEVALRLLDAEFPDENVRAFALRILDKLPDDQLEGFLLQLTQAVKFEARHDSVLARFLLKRALTNKRIGHFFFWYLKCEMYNPQYTARFGVILEAYLKGCGEAMLTRYLDQTEIQKNLEKIAAKLKDECRSDHSKMQAALPAMLKQEGIQKFVFTPVYNPRIQLGKLIPAKCKIMPSAKKPFWLELQNVHPTAMIHTPTRLILKLGDDLRQDMITLQMLSLFEKLWEEQGLDLELIPYGCMATGPQTGFIEVVKNAKTIAEVSGVRNNKKLLEWIMSHQTNEFGEVDLDKVKAAVKRFTHSCAGYSVATYILGIGDRHNENIMVTTSGNLFHIDFGHFLGNIKYCMGFKREWAPFVLTPDFVYVMGGEGSETFEMYKNLCCRAFLILRRHAELMINLFSMMRSTGIPELSCVEDTDYIRMALALDRSEHDAQEAFRNVLKKCLDLKWTVQVMWKMHLFKKNLLTNGSSS